jgi:competence protein ComEC
MKKKYFLFVAGFLLALNIFCWKEVFVLAQSQNLKVDFLDVGQGDSVFIKTPENHQIIIDGGPSSAVLQKLSERMPFWDRTIDLIILTHPEKDHMLGLIYVLQRYKADYILWTGVKKTDAEYNQWSDILEKQKNMGAKIIAVKAGDAVKLGDVIIDVLFPLESVAGQNMKNTSNDSGVVSKLIFGIDSFLLTGDTSSAEEKQLANSFESVNLESDVLKVAHHGSKYSTSDLFLENVKPKIAVISVGKDNSYGHPTGEVLQRLEKFGIKIFRTDIDGDIKMVSDGDKIVIKN